MDLSYYYQLTPGIDRLLHKLAVMKDLIELLPNLPDIEENLRRKSLLKSSLFSARIEGNRLKMENISFSGTRKVQKNMEKMEVFNILKALQSLRSDVSRKLDITFMLNLHKIVMTGLAPEAGYLRHEPSAIFNQAGVAVYMTPPPSEIRILLDKFMDIANSSKDPGPVNAAISHFIFEKIHPFLDGNGRVGRLIAVHILGRSGFGFRGIVSFEQYLEETRDRYYYLLGGKDLNITEFVEYFLEGLLNKARDAVENIKNLKKEQPEDSLLPRRREILETIRDHEMVTFDFIRRRFMGVTVSTLHFDLKRLVASGLIRKLGSTRGVCYTIKSQTISKNLDFEICHL